MRGLTLQDVIGRLGPTSPNIWIGVGTLILMTLAGIALLFQKKPNIPIQLMLTSVILIALIDKIAVAAPSAFIGNGQASAIPGLGNTSIYLLLMRVPLFVFPFVSAGMIRGRENGRGVLPAIICGFMGMAYVFMRWFLEMRG